MVFIEDRDGIYNAPIDKVWKLAQAHATEGAKIHPSAKNVLTEMLNENTFVNSWDEEINGQNVRIETRGTIYYPLGIAFEIIKGPFEGSKYFTYYISRSDDKTNVVVAGNFQSETIDDNKLKSTVLSVFEKVFEEDSAYLKYIQ